MVLISDVADRLKMRMINFKRVYCILVFFLSVLFVTEASALPQGWERTDNASGTVSFRHPGESKLVTFAELKASSDGRRFDFSKKSELEKFKILSSMLQDLGYCTERAVYDTALFMLYCRGTAKDDSGEEIPVIAYVKMENTRLLLILGFYNATRRDVFDLIENFR